MREKGWEESGPKASSKNSDFGTPMILRYSLVAFQLSRAIGFWASQCGGTCCDTGYLSGVIRVNRFARFARIG